jgi:hypothetical protein
MIDQEDTESLKRGQDYEERQKRSRDDFLDGTKGVLMSTEGQCIVVSVACVCSSWICLEWLPLPICMYWLPLGGG